MTDDNLQLAADEEARIEAILRSMSDSDLELDTPPAGLWDDIAAAMNPDVLVAAPSAPEPEEHVTAGADVIDITSRFRRGTAFFAAAAAAVIVVIGAVVVSAGSDDPSTEVVGEAELVWDEGFVAEGTDLSISTTILNDGTTQAVRIDEGSLPTRSDEDLELWLIGVDAAGELTIQTLGVIDDAAGAYDIPDSFDPDSFETVLVDISFEPRDGVETHSGASIVRGPIIEA